MDIRIELPPEAGVQVKAFVMDVLVHHKKFEGVPTWPERYKDSPAWVTEIHGMASPMGTIVTKIEVTDELDRVSVRLLPSDAGTLAFDATDEIFELEVVQSPSQWRIVTRPKGSTARVADKLDRALAILAG